MRSIRQQKTDLDNLNLAYKANRSSRIKVVCCNCKTERLIPPSVLRKGWRFCDWKCRTEYMKAGNAPNSGGGQWMKGENNPNWKGGCATERRISYKKGEQAQWSRRVLYRDNYICRKCNKGSRFLRAHHIAQWKDFPNLRFKLSNGITLCKKCHHWVHSKKNTRNRFLILPAIKHIEGRS